jgi:imidazolonepropionase
VTTLLLRHISELTTNDPTLGDESPMGRLRDAAMVVDEERVLWVGPAAAAPPPPPPPPGGGGGRISGVRF